MPMRKYTLQSGLLALIVWQVAATPCRAVERVPDEFQVKAAMVFNIAKYVDWPPSVFAQESTPMTICSLGTGGFTSAVDDLQGKQFKGRPVTVRQVSKPDDGRSCHVLAVGDADQNLIQAFLSKLRNQPVLTIGDRDRFAHSGGVVGFYTQGGKVRFEVNLSSALQHQLKISSQLLKLARIVRQEIP